MVYSGYLGIDLINNIYTTPKDGVYKFVVYNYSNISVIIGNETVGVFTNNNSLAVVTTIPFKKGTKITGGTNNNGTARVDGYFYIP